MSLAARRRRALLVLALLPLLGLAARFASPQAGQVFAVLVLLGLLSTLPLLAVLIWLGKTGSALRWAEERLHAVAALWSPEPGAAWLAWAARSGHLDRARRWIGRAAEEGHAEGRLELALAYLDGAYGAGGDAAALPLLEGLAQEGHPEGMAHLALALFWGRGRPRDPAAALRWMRRAAERGHGPAAAWLARAYAMGDGVAADPAEAERWRALATADPLPRPGLLARMRTPSEPGAFEAAALQVHEGLHQAFEAIFADPLLRRGFLALAALLFGLPLLILLGMLLIGWSAIPIFFIPLPISFLLAWSWRDGRARVSRQARRTWKAAEAGDPAAAFALGLAFERGDRDHPQDPAAARTWYQRAAQAGHLDAAYRLGELLAWGQGGWKDRKGARHWLGLAAQGGHGPARARLAALDSHEADTDR